MYHLAIKRIAKKEVRNAIVSMDSDYTQA